MFIVWPALQVTLPKSPNTHRHTQTYALVVRCASEAFPYTQTLIQRQEVRRLVTWRKENKERKKRRRRRRRGEEWGVEVIEWDKMLPFIVFLWEHWDRLGLLHQHKHTKISFYQREGGGARWMDGGRWCCRGPLCSAPKKTQGPLPLTAHQTHRHTHLSNKEHVYTRRHTHSELMVLLCEGSRVRGQWVRMWCVFMLVWLRREEK